MIYRFRAFADYLRDVRGNPPGTIHKKLCHLTGFEQFRHARGSTRLPIQLPEIDAYIVTCRRRFARTTVADICSTIRGYLRFLHVTGRATVDLSRSVMAPIVRPAERPHRTLAWPDVQQILRAIDRSTPVGRRDYALLLMMSVYGLGVGEIIALSLDDVDWRAATLRITRPKTRVVFSLPLLPNVARALADYLKHGRPAHTPARHLFVTMRTPFKRLACAVTVRHILQGGYVVALSGGRQHSGVVRIGFEGHVLGPREKDTDLISPVAVMCSDVVDDLRNEVEFISEPS